MFGTIEPKGKKRSGVPTGNAGEYFVMGELLRRGFDAQLADRNTQGYDVLVGRASDPTLLKVQIKTARSQRWYVRLASFEGSSLAMFTIYVLLGTQATTRPVRYFVARNQDVASALLRQKDWPTNGFMPLKAVLPFENRWNDLLAA